MWQHIGNESTSVMTMTQALGSGNCLPTSPVAGTRSRSKGASDVPSYSGFDSKKVTQRCVSSEICTSHVAQQYDAVLCVKVRALKLYRRPAIAAENLLHSAGARACTKTKCACKQNVFADKMCKQSPTHCNPYLHEGKEFGTP